MTRDRVAQIESRLNDAFAPTYLQVKDQSHLHAGHAGAKDGLGHFAITIASSSFDGLPRIRSHQAIYEALGELMQTDIHALSISIRRD